jgi:hypothetical protein
MMTHSYASGPSSGSDPSTGQAVRQEAANVGQGAAQAGGQVAQTAKEQTREVVRETATQARNLVGEAQGELRHQTSMQQKRAAEGLRALGSELHSMAGHGAQEGLAADLVHQAAGRAHRMADWLEQREPGQVLDEVRQFARRRPGAFLAGALVAGVVVGRLTRSLAASGGSSPAAEPTTPAAHRAAYPATEPAAYPATPATGPAYDVARPGVLADDTVALPAEVPGYPGGARS